ncbi:UNVERIFIED_CONTAM: hypothetical protein K2H54_042920 [Gekko kuhli]
MKAAVAARLEYYESEKKWRSKAAAPKRAIALDACLNIHKRADAKHKHLIALYTRDEYFALAAESEAEQEAWFRALTELLRDSQAAGQGPPPPAEDAGSAPLLPPPASAPPPAYREVWQVTLKAKGLGQSRQLTGVHRLCLAARTVGLVRLNCERPCVTLQLMNIRRCGHSDSFFFMELGRSAATGPGELWMQADDAVVAQNIHETILEAMKALRELAEFRPRSKSQSSSSSSSSGGAAVAGGFSAVGSRPISVPGRRHHHHHHHPPPPPPLGALPPSQTGILRRSRTDTLAAAGGGGNGGGNSSRARTASEGDGGRGGSLAGSPLSPDAGRTPLSRSHTLGTASSSSGRPGRSLALGHSPSVLSKLALEPGLLSKRPSSSSASASGSPGDPAAFMAFEDLSSSPGGDPRAFSSSSNHSDTPETPPGQQLDGYMAMERGRLCYRPYLWENGARVDKAPRKRTYSLTTPAHQRPLPLPLSSASLDEYTLMRATVPPTGASSRTAYNPYPEDYCDLEIGSGGTSSSSSSHLGPSGGAEENYMPMSPGVASASPGKPCSNPYMPMSPTSVSAPQQILQPRPYKTSSESSPDDSGYMRMWGAGGRLSGESPEGRLVNGDYLNMSPVLHGPSTASASPLPSPDGFGGLGPGGRPSCLCGPLTHASQNRPSSQGQEKDSDQYVHMNSLAWRLIQAPKGETACNHIVMPLPMRHSQTESALSQQAGLPTHSGVQPSHRSLGTLLLGRSKEPFPGKLQSPSGGDYVSLGYSVAPPGGLFPLRSGPGGPPGSLLSNYMNLNLNGSHSGTVSVGSVEDVLLPGSCPSLGQPDEHYLRMEMGVACLSSPSSEVGDYAEVAFSTATTLPQPISHKPESPRVASPVAGLKRLTISGVEAFLFANPPPDPDHGAKVIRADPQGRRRHSSETFSSTTTVTPVSPSFAHVPKRHNSASVENVSLRKNEGFVEEQNSSPMCRETSAGFQNGLNYIAVDGERDHLANGSLNNPKARHPLDRSINDTYASMDFLAHNGKEATSVKGQFPYLIYSFALDRRSQAVAKDKAEMCKP